MKSVSIVWNCFVSEYKDVSSCVEKVSQRHKMRWHRYSMFCDHHSECDLMLNNDGLDGPVVRLSIWGRYHGGRWRQFSQSNLHSTIDTQQTEYHEALPLSANVQSHLTLLFADNGNALWYLVCRMPMVEWRLDCENCHHLTVVVLHDTGPWRLLCTVLCCNVMYCDVNEKLKSSWPKIGAESCS